MSYIPKHSSSKHNTQYREFSPFKLKGRYILLAVIIAVIVIGAFQLTRSYPPALGSLTPAAQRLKLPGPTITVPTPTSGEFIVGVGGVGIVAKTPNQTQSQIASMTKMMTALVVLRDHPLTTGASGPSITITPADVATYNADLALTQSVVPVTVGEQLTERQALEAMLIPSGNNIASLLAAWDGGSQAAFVAKMNSTAKQLGMTHTTYADAAGASAATISTPSDQLKLLEVDMAIPTFAHIVAIPQIVLPVAGLVYNVNADLGTDGIVGAKTGFTGHAGGCFAFVAQHNIAGSTLLIEGVVMGMGGVSPLTTSLNEAVTLINSVTTYLNQFHIIYKGETLGMINTSWGGVVPLVAASPASFFGWGGLRLHAVLIMVHNMKLPITAGEDVGLVKLTVGSHTHAVPLLAAKPINSPSVFWKLLRL